MSVPPYGQTDNAVVIPKGYTATQSPFSFSASIVCAANVCTATATAHGLETGEWIHVSGTSTDADVQPATISSGSQSGTTASLTASANVTFPNGALVYFEGGGLSNIAGTFTVGGVSGADFTATVLESATRTFTCPTCTANYAVQITVTGANTFTYAKTGATGSGTGTVTMARMIPPIQGGTFVEPGFDSPVTVKTFLNSSSSTTGNGIYIETFHSTQPSINASGDIVMVGFNTSGPGFYNVSDGSFIRQLGLGGSAATKWDFNTPNKVWLRSGDTLRYVTDVTLSGTSAVERDFGADGCTEIGIAGPTTAHEGPGTTKGGRIAIVCKISASPETWDLIVYNTTTSAIEARFVGNATSGTGNIDYFHVVEQEDGTLLGAGARWSTGGAQNVSVARSGSTITVTGSGFSHVTDGRKFRLFGCSNNDFHRLYTIDSHTSTTLVATDATVTATSATGCEVGTEARGLVWYEKSGSDLVMTNNLRWVGQHGQFGHDAAGEAVWFGQVTDAICTTYGTGIATYKADPSYWTAASANYANAKKCQADFTAVTGSQDANMSIGNCGWALASTFATSSPGPNATEANLTSGWDDVWYQRPGEGELSIMKLVSPGESSVVHRLLHLRNHIGGTTPRNSLSRDCRYIVYNSNFRYQNGSGGPHVMLVDLGAWAAGGISLTSVSPDEGTQNTVVPVTLTGAGMDGANPSITISGADVTASNIVVNGATEWDADFTIGSSAATGTRTVTVTTDDGTSNSVGFTVNAAATPTLSAVHPGTRARGTNVTVTFSGANFDPSATLTVSGTGITTEITFISATQVVATLTVDAAATLGVRTVSITTDAGTTGNQNFTVLSKETVVSGIPV